MENFSEWLEGKFMKRGEFGGIPILKDDFEELFSSYMDSKTSWEIMEIADQYSEYIKQEVLKDVKKLGEILEK